MLNKIKNNKLTVSMIVLATIFYVVMTLVVDNQTAKIVIGVLVGWFVGSNIADIAWDKG